MKVTTHRLLACALACLLLGGCLSLGGGSSRAQPEAHSDRYSLTEQVATSSTGCDYRYRVFSPEHKITRTSVVLGHGFLRDQNTMSDLAKAMANQGIQVITLDFCNMRPWNGNHRQNAKDMQALAKSLGVHTDIIYAGFSAGALAAVLASDATTRAILALDLVDQKEIGLEAIRQSPTPLIGLAGSASGCNANNNGSSLFTARKQSSLSSLLKVDSASHCEFESPSNWLCEIACGDSDNSTVATMTRRSIIHESIERIRPFLSPSDKPESAQRLSASELLTPWAYNRTGR